MPRVSFPSDHPNIVGKILGQSKPKVAAKAAPKANKKVKNATPKEYNGVVYGSGLEAFCAQMLTEAGLPFSVKEKVTLQEAIEYPFDTTAVKGITMYPDFLLPGVAVIDTKGYANDIAPLKYKLLKAHYMKGATPLPILMPSTNIQVRVIVDLIKTQGKWPHDIGTTVSFRSQPKDPQTKILTGTVERRYMHCDGKTAGLAYTIRVRNSTRNVLFSSILP